MKVSYAVFYRYPDGWGQIGIVGEREAMAQYLRAKPGSVKFINLDTNQEATWEDYRRPGR